MFDFRYAHYTIKLVNKKYNAENGSTYPQTAIVSYFDDKERLIHTVDYGYIPTCDIYSIIDESKTINLDYCYVKNFSLTAYRRSRIIDKKEVVCLKSLSARNAFFHSDFQIDFTYMDVDSVDVDFSQTMFAHGTLDFKNSHFGDCNVDFSQVFVHSKLVDFSNTTFGKGDVSFKNSVFSPGIKNFQYADFGEGELNFVNVEFGGGDVSFINSNFNKGNTLFKITRFGDGDVDFHYSKFGSGDISFERADFANGFVNFKNVEFGSGKVNFNRSVFGQGDLSFEGCAAVGKITFKKAIIADGDLNFELAEMEKCDLNFEKSDLGKGAISFLNSEFRDLSLSGCQINDYLDLRVSRCKLVDLSDTIVRDIIDLKPFKEKIDIDLLNISGMRLLGIIYIDWLNNRVKDIIVKQKNTSLEEKADQFLVLKESFNKSGRYNDEDSAYLWYKRYEALTDLESKERQGLLSKLIYYPIYGFKKLVFDYVGKYATSPVRVLFSMIVTLAIFGLLYSFVLFAGAGGIVSGLGGEHDLLGVFGRSFYHSGITFFTIGYGDFYPLGAVRWLSNVEGFVGVFLMSYFTVAFVRKILR